MKLYSRRTPEKSSGLQVAGFPSWPCEIDVQNTWWVISMEKSMFLLLWFLIFHSEYTKSVIDLRPEDVGHESGALGDRSKSVPGLSVDMVNTLVFHLVTI